jgi:hypothetical protein
MVHDRYQSLEESDVNQIGERRLEVEELEKQHLKSVLAELMADCLEQRKLQLKGVIYKRPTNDNLVLIFKRLSPNFE